MWNAENDLMRAMGLGDFDNLGKNQDTLQDVVTGAGKSLNRGKAARQNVQEDI